jgi:hypothetical protein
MATDDQLSSLLDRASTILTRQNDWADGQVALMAGTKDDPASFNAVGGKTGDLGYYPVKNVNGQTVYMPCLERQQAIAEAGVVTVEAAMVNKTRDRVTLREIAAGTSTPAVPTIEDPTHNNRDLFLELFTDINAGAVQGGRKGVLDGFKYASTPLTFSPTENICIEGVPGRSGIVGLQEEATKADAVLKFEGDTARPYVSISGLIIDASARMFLAQKASGSGINLRNLEKATVDNCVLIGGYGYPVIPADPNTPYAGGDSGVVPTLCDYVEITRNLFKYWLDKSVYPSGLSAAVDPETVRSHIYMSGNTHFHCNTAASLTRGGMLLQVLGDRVLECRNGFSHTEVGSAPIIPGLGIIITNVLMSKVGWPFRLFGGHGRTVIDNVVVQDWGYDPKDMSLMPSASAVIMAEGLYGAEINFNAMMRYWKDSTQHRGYEFRDYDYDNSDSRSNQLAGRIANIPNGIGIMENNGAFGNHSRIMMESVGAHVAYTGNAPNSRHEVLLPNGDKTEYLNGLPFTGKWTPTILFLGVTGHTFDTANATHESWYERKGDEVTVHVRVLMPYSGLPAGTSGEIRLTGLPWAVETGKGSGHGQGGTMGGITYPSGATTPYLEAPAGATYLRLRFPIQTSRSVLTSDLTGLSGTLRVEGSITYRADTTLRWNPSYVSKAVIGWYDAMDQSTLDLIGTNKSVLRLRNKGKASGAVLTNPTAAKQPLYSLIGWDDSARPCLIGNGGVDGQILSTATGLPGNYWLFVVAERAAQTNTDTSTSSRALVSTGGAGGNRVHLSVQTPSADPDQTSVSIFSSGTGGGSATATPWAVDSKAIIFCKIAATTSIGLNGAAPSGAGAIGTGTPSEGFALFGLPEVGGSNNVSRFPGKIAEVLVIDPAQLAGGGTDAERQRIEGGLAHKWNIQSLLVTGHPYKTTAPEV